jgi:hypothetical protein
LQDKITSALASGQQVVLKGGGGMGAGTEYLDKNNQEITPHALSTQAGFDFRFVLLRNTPSGTAAPISNNSLEATINQDQDVLYQQMAKIYQTANDQALKACGNSYSNYDCTCETSHAIVICLAQDVLGKTAELPQWLIN